MTLVGSLVLFLLELFYGGRYEGRMQWILFSFVFCAVLIARISMTPEIAARAPLYGIGLGLVVWFALGKFVEFPPDTPLATFSWAINLGLIALIWWSAHKLTWDCTYIDETVDASGAGLLETTGLEAGDGVSTAAEEPIEAEPEGTGWWSRYMAYRERQSRRPHSPGVWIVYFSLAALPLFGLGQTLISVEDTEVRQCAFWFMAVYVASALGLLLSTSFLGLRRYLRQRNLQMPVSMTTMWLGIGGALIAVLLVVGALLPRPNPEYSLISLTKLGSADREASKYSPGGDEPGKGGGRAGSQGAKDGQGNASGKSDDAGGKGQGSKTGSEQGKAENSDGKGKDGSDSGSQPGKGKDQASQKTSDSQKQSSSQDQKSGSEEAKGEAENADGSSGDSSSLQPLGQVFSKLSQFLKWIVFILVGIIVAFLLIRAMLRFLANFSGWAKGILAALERLWRSLFGWLTPSALHAETAERSAPTPRPRPFSSFANPFHSGTASSPEEVVRYSFEALEAWGYERGVSRQDDDTPLEFADRIGFEQSELANVARRLAARYARAAYGRGKLPPTALDAVKQFWQKIESLDHAPAVS